MWLSRFFILLCFSCAAFAQEWPSKPVKFVSPYPPGGSVDPLARLFAAKLTDSLKQQFIVENRTGASGIIGTDYVAKSAPDGYTFVFIFDTHSVHQALNPKLPFDPVKDFAPVMLVGYAPMAITTGAMKPYKSFADVHRRRQGEARHRDHGQRRQRLARAPHHHGAQPGGGGEARAGALQGRRAALAST